MAEQSHGKLEDSLKPLKYRTCFTHKNLIVLPSLAPQTSSMLWKVVKFTRIKRSTKFKYQSIEARTIMISIRGARSTPIEKIPWKASVKSNNI